MNSQKCKDCAYYTAYYKKLSSSFEKTNVGVCSKHKKIKTYLENCGEFKNNERREKENEKRLFVFLEQALKSINDISQILKEKQEG